MHDLGEGGLQVALPDRKYTPSLYPDFVDKPEIILLRHFRTGGSSPTVHISHFFVL